MRKSKIPAMKPRRRASRLRPLEDSEIISALKEVCRRDFTSFASMCVTQLTGASLPLSLHLEAISFRLDQVRRGKIKKLMINAPPDYGKSFLTSILLPAYLLGLDPTIRIIVVSYGLELAVKLSNDFRAIVNSPWYKSIFPDIEISRTKNTENEIVTTRGGYRLAGSLDGALTGRRCDILIIDDPLKRSDAYSASKRKRVNDRFRDTLFSMLEKKKGVIIIAAQRLHVDDLCGSLLSESDDWTRLSLSAVAEKDEQIEIGEGRYYERRKDEPLDAKRESKEDWDAVQSHVGPDAWAAQYQQYSEGRPLRSDFEGARRGHSRLQQRWMA